MNVPGESHRTRIGLLACCATLTCVSAAPSAEPGLLSYVTAHQDRRFAEVPREVLAFYYTWYGRPDSRGGWLHWGGDDPVAHDIPESTNYPIRGAYDSLDPALMDAHIAEARAHGLTGFIATWWQPGDHEDHAFRLLLDRAEKQSFRAAIYWETVPGTGREQIDRAINDLVYVITHYGSHPAYLTVQGKPVIFSYGRVMGQVPMTSWPAILTAARTRAGDFVLVVDGYRDQFARVFDGVHTYNICAEIAGLSPDELRDWSATRYAEAVDLARHHGKISCLTVIPGYDDRKIRTPGIHAARQDGETYRVLWEESIRADPDWILITSWNEWHEGSEIEPSREHGDRELKRTAVDAPRFLQQPPAQASPPPTVPSETAQALRERFAGRTIGVLPDAGAAAYWLLNAGLSLRELSWAEVADPAVLNPRDLPLLLHAGSESYASHGRIDGDVIPALQRYLTLGGFLVCIPWQPFPFHYDRSRGDMTQPATQQAGLPVQYAWEQPPDDATLTFRFNTDALPKLPTAALFPRRGDLRWRPAQRDLTNPTDTYLPLATLIDEDGQARGDGIAYVEHQTPPLQGGRTLYAWMRMADVAGDDLLYPALFHFIADRLDQE